MGEYRNKILRYRKYYTYVVNEHQDRWGIRNSKAAFGRFSNKVLQ